MATELVAGLGAFLQVILIDIVLAGDNAIVVALAAASLPIATRRKVIIIGIAIAVVLRIIGALTVTHLLAIPGVMLVGGLLLGWVCLRLWHEIHEHPVMPFRRVPSSCCDDEFGPYGNLPMPAPFRPHLPRAGEAGPKTTAAAIQQIVVADVSMSLDNVLAVAGAAREHPSALIFGLALSVVLMASLASLIADWLKRWPSLAYVGVGVIALVTLRMLKDGIADLM